MTDKEIVQELIPVDSEGMAQELEFIAAVTQGLSELELPS